MGLKPVKPQNAAGMRTDPPVSVPIAATAISSQIETAAPEDDPPGIRRAGRSNGFAGVPWCGFSPSPENANSVIFVRPIMTPPAARKRSTTTASCAAAGASASTIDPAVVGSPRISKRSLTETGMPPSQPVQIPARRLRSIASASARAASANRCTNVREPSPDAAVARSRQFSTRDLLVVTPESRAARKVSIIPFMLGWRRSQKLDLQY